MEQRHGSVSEPKVGLRRQVFVLGLTGGERLRLDVEVPQGAVTLRELLPVIQAMCGAVFSHSAAGLAKHGLAVTCGPGCGACCSQLVPISRPEALLLADFVHSLPPTRRTVIEDRFRRIVARLEESGLLARLLAGFVERPLGLGALAELQRAYWPLGLACPFLEDGSCSVYPHRPVICRQYSVTTPPERCARLFEPGVTIREVPHPLELAGTLACFDGARARATAALPLSLSLLLEKTLRAERLPKVPGPEMISRFLELAARRFEPR